jgi:hypothetical protein
MKWTVKEKSMNSFQNEWWSPSVLRKILLYSTAFYFGNCFPSSLQYDIFWISKLLDLSITEKTIIEMPILCIKTGIVLVKHFNSWVEVCAGGLQSPRVSAAHYLTTSVLAWKYEYMKWSLKKKNPINLILKKKEDIPRALLNPSTDLYLF